MEVIVTDAARAYVRDHGGVLFVRVHRHRCCGSPLTLLDVATAPPPDPEAFVSVATGDVDVHFAGGSAGRPEQLRIDLRGHRRPHPVALWDGCQYRL